MKTQADYRRQAYYQNWFIKKILPIIGIVLLIAILIFGIPWADDAHDTFKTVPEGEITVLENNKTIYVPEGAFILGEVHPYSASEDVVFDEPLVQNQPLKAEELVKTYGTVVIYWSLDQQVTAESMLDN